MIKHIKESLPRALLYGFICGLLSLIGSFLHDSGKQSICREIAWQSQTCLEIRKELLGENE